jgi:ribosomal protein L37AE/L43A
MSLLDQIEAFNEEFPCPICEYGIVILNNDHIYQCDKCDYRGWFVNINKSLME